MRKLFLSVLLPIVLCLQLKAQCTLVSSGCGYSITIGVQPISIIPSTTNCTNGYNYNVRFTYTINVKGVNTCYNNNVGIQPQIICSGQNNGYYTINVPAPAVGAAAVNANYSGTLTTTTNPSRNVNDCNTATPTSLGCNNLQVTVFGPGFSTTTYTCGFSALPIELISFSGECLNDQINLKWATASERNNKYFSIEGSNNAVNWEEADQVKGAGNSSQLKNYSLVLTRDKSNFRYFRLRQTDYDLTYKYSDIITVKQCNLVDSGVEVFPNPANDIIYLSADTPYYSVQLVNQLSQEVYSAPVAPGFISTSGFSNGIYFLKLSSGSKTTIKKIIISH